MSFTSWDHFGNTWNTQTLSAFVRYPISPTSSKRRFSFQSYVQAGSEWRGDSERGLWSHTAWVWTSQFHSVLAAWFWVSHVTSLCLSFSIWKVRAKHYPPPRVLRIEAVNGTRHSERHRALCVAQCWVTTTSSAFPSALDTCKTESFHWVKKVKRLLYSQCMA